MPVRRNLNPLLQYDPKDVDIRLQHFTVAKMVSMIEEGRLEILEENDLQRLPDLWDERRKSLLIESLMINLPLPMFYFDGSDRPWRVIDGLQRLTTIYQFISESSNQRFVLKHLEYLREDYDGDSFDLLPLYMQRRILEAPIEAFVINPGTSASVKYSIFQRINTLGLILNGQEIRNAVYRGTPSNFVKELAIEEAFLRATNGKVAVKRMVDREYATRFIAFYRYRDEYFPTIDEFLRQALESLYKDQDDTLHQLKGVFVNTMNRAYDLLGSYAFYRYLENGHPRGRTPNKAIYDTLSWNLAKLNMSEFDTLLQNRDQFIRNYILMQNSNETFVRAINDTTSSRTAVNNRFNILEDFIRNIV